MYNIFRVTGEEPGSNTAAALHQNGRLEATAASWVRDCTTVTRIGVNGGRLFVG